ncbi:MAG: diaminopimelate decarboxylase [bacterium]
MVKSLVPMPLKWIKDRLCIDEVPVDSLAEEYGTPLYAYSATVIRARCADLHRAFKPLKPSLHYAIKANPRLAILRLIHEEDYGAEVVSFGECHAALKAGFMPHEIIFNGNGKTAEEVRDALRADVNTFNFDSLDQWEILEEEAGHIGKPVHAFLRINPGVETEHPHLAVGETGSKFGMSEDEIKDGIGRLKHARHATVKGVHCHVGSQILKAKPFIEAAKKAAHIFQKLKREGLPLDALNLGGGFGVPYRDTDYRLDFKELVAGLRAALKGISTRILFEPGRFLVAESGIIISRIVSLKDNHILVLDAGMTEIIRPSLYGAHHAVEPAFHIDHRRKIHAPAHRNSHSREGEEHLRTWEIVGPVCESADSFFQKHSLGAISTGALMVIRNAGAYCASMQMNYNGRPFPPEVLIDQSGVTLIRRRQSVPDLLSLEYPL